MADDLVHRSTNRFGKTLVVEGCGNRFLHIDDMVMANPVKLPGRNARLNERLNHLQYFSGESSRLTHPSDVIVGFD